MCFFISSKFPNELIAENNIRCYKIGTVNEKSFRSLYKDFYYVYGRCYKLETKLTPWFYRSKIEKGFHSYAYIKYARNMISILSMDRIVKCTIPKGAKYYFNGVEYVSDRIIIHK